jgi:membrane peptidoglycan carboxypeptidase
MLKLGRPARDEGGLIHQFFVIIGISVLAGALMAGLALPWVGLATQAAQSSAEAMKSFPLKLEFKPLNQRTEVLDSQGGQLATFYDENRTYVHLGHISDNMKKALLSIEDARFYQHGPIDIQGTLRALVVNSTSSDVQGGSSLTQQLVKMTLLENATTKKEQAAATVDSYARKFLELRYAVWVERHLTKDQILEHYLNTAYFGDGAYGIQAAAHHYFNTTAAKLTLPQSAMLAGLVKNPSSYDPTNSKLAATDRRDTVIQRMLQLHVVTTKHANRAMREPLGLKITQIPNGCVVSEAPWFCNYLLSYLLQDPALGKTADERKHEVYGGGLTIKSTLDPRFQRAATTAVANNVDQADPAIGALAMVEPGTGKVRAVAQSRPMGNNKAKGETSLNFTVPKKYGGAAGFQPGSTFKAFVLSAAIRKGIPLTTSFYSPSPKTVDLSQYQTCSGKPYGTGPWVVHNEGEAGTYNVFSGTAASVNTFFIQLEQMTGLCAPFRLANKMGMNLPASDQEPVLTLGVADESPVAMADAYATFANRGVYCPATPVEEIRDRNEHVIPLPKEPCQRIMRPAYADAVNKVFQGVMAPGGTGAALKLDQPTAGKTGTTDNAKAVWFIGYTPNLAAASVVAGVTPTLKPRSVTGLTLNGVYVSFASGGGTAGPIWLSAMQAIERYLPDTAFVPPDPSVVKGQPVAIPSYFGQNPDAVARALTKLGFHAQISSSVNSRAPVGTVAYTTPTGRGFSGQTVLIYISSGYTPPPPPPPPPPTQPPPKPPGGGGGGGGGGHHHHHHHRH